MNDEVGAAGLRGEVNGSAVLLDDAMDDSEAEACAYADGLGCVKGVEDVCLNVERDSAAVIADANAKASSWLILTGDRFLCPCADGNTAMLWNGVYGVVEKIGPDLIEAGAIRM